MSSCDVIDGGLLGGPVFICTTSDYEEPETPADPGPFTAHVRRYLADCYANREILRAKYHPTERGALAVISHRADQAKDVKASAYKLVRSGR